MGESLEEVEKDILRRKEKSLALKITLKIIFSVIYFGVGIVHLLLGAFFYALSSGEPDLAFKMSLLAIFSVYFLVYILIMMGRGRRKKITLLTLLSISILISIVIIISDMIF